MKSGETKIKRLTPEEANHRARRFRLMRSIRVVALGGLWAVFSITMNFAPHWLGLGLVVILGLNAALDYRDMNRPPRK